MKKVSDLRVKNDVLEEKQCIRVKFRFMPDNDDDYSVIIYRREEKNYHLRQQGKEYFDTMTPCKEDVIFEGKLTPEYYYTEYIDYDIEVDKTYVYWVGRQNVLEDVGAPVPVKARDPYICWNFEKIDGKMRSLEENFEGVEIVQFGETIRHKPLKAIIAGNRENLLAFVGTIHAAESGPEILLRFLEDVLTNSPELLKKTGVAIMPSANLDGRERMAEGSPWYIRQNENGVDLNRNFDCDWQDVSTSYGCSTAVPECETYRGVYPDSEPETRALINMVTTLKPKAVMSFHWLSSVTGDSALSARKAFRDNNTAYIKRVDEMTRIYTNAFRDCAGVARIDESERRTNYGDSSSGSFITWCYSQDIAAVDFEAWNEWNKGPLKGAEIDETTREQLDFATRCHTAAIKALMLSDFKG